MPAVWSWAMIAAILCLTSFGFRSTILAVLSTLACMLGAGVAVYSSKRRRVENRVNQLYASSQGLPAIGLPQVMCHMPNIPKKLKHDRRLTGSITIDEQLQEVLQFVFRDYIYAWYHQMSANEEFPFHIRETIQKVIICCASRAKEVEWVPYVTTRLVDDFASHLRLFRKAQAKIKEKKQKEPEEDVDLLSVFFELEAAMERNLCRDVVSTSESDENGYLQDLTEVLLYLLLPPEDFQDKALRFFLREILVNVMILPVITLISSPDYINQTIVWLCKDSLVSSEVFLTVLRCTDSADELQSIRDIVSHEIAVHRSKDTGGNFGSASYPKKKQKKLDAEIKQQLSSLLYVKRVVEIRLRRLQEGNLDTDSTGLPSEIDWKKLTEPGARLFALPFDVVLTNNIALHYFIEYMTSKSAQGLVFFYHATGGFKVSAEQQLSEIHLSQMGQMSETSPDIEGLKEAAVHIYDLFLSDKASTRVKLDEGLLKKLLVRIRTERPSENWFDEAQAKVYEMMQEEPYFLSFKKSPGYIKLLAELDLLRDSGGRSDEEELAGSKSGLKCPSDEGSLDCVSLSSLEQEEEATEVTEISLMEMLEDLTICAHIYNTGIVTELGTQYAMYAISVVLQKHNVAVERWCIVRRYSDFHSFHLSLIEKFPELSHLQLPGKKTFNNLSRRFLEKRAQLLNQYLQSLLSLSQPGLQQFLFQFLEPGSYDKKRKLFAKSMGPLVSPLKQSIKTMGGMVRTMPDALLDGLKDGLVKVLGGRFASSLTPGLSGSEKVAAGIDIEGDDNIPLRIMLLLMDEVFDLKSKDQWFRRRIVVLLRQIFKATFGDTINRKIVDHVGWMTSSDQVAEYVKSLRQSFWPNGSLALPQPERDQSTKMRTRVAAKMMLLCTIPDELKHVIGTETTRKGILCVFEMFQQPELNRRLTYVLLEGILETLFPDNYLPELFRRLHSQSPHMQGQSSTKWPSSTQPLPTKEQSR